MKEANKKSKKKVLLTYLILAACLLVIAAVTVTVIFTVGHKSPDLSIDNPPAVENPNDGDKPTPPNQGDDDKDTPTNTETGYKIPVNNAQIATKYEFAHNNTIAQFRVHQGIDFEGSAGDNVFAALDGTVTKVVASHLLGENYVTIQHADGISTTYKYIDAKNGLKVGDKVKRGEVIGTIAAAAGYEKNQGEHLHFEMKLNGKTVDPEIYLDLVEK